MRDAHAREVVVSKHQLTFAHTRREEHAHDAPIAIGSQPVRVLGHGLRCGKLEAVPSPGVGKQRDDPGGYVSVGPFCPGLGRCETNPGPTAAFRRCVRSIETGPERAARRVAHPVTSGRPRPPNSATLRPCVSSRAHALRCSSPPPSWRRHLPQGRDSTCRSSINQPTHALISTSSRVGAGAQGTRFPTTSHAGDATTRWRSGTARSSA